MKNRRSLHLGRQHRHTHHGPDEIPEPRKNLLEHQGRDQPQPKPAPVVNCWLP